MSETFQYPLVSWRTAKENPVILVPLDRIRQRIDFTLKQTLSMRTGQEIIELLNEQATPHHYEFVPGQWDALVLRPDRNDKPEPAFGYVIILHVYDEDVAFDLRLRFNSRPLYKDWRESYASKGSLRTTKTGLPD